MATTAKQIADFYVQNLANGSSADRKALAKALGFGMKESGWRAAEDAQYEAKLAAIDSDPALLKKLYEYTGLTDPATRAAIGKTGTIASGKEQSGYYNKSDLTTFLSQGWVAQGGKDGASYGTIINPKTGEYLSVVPGSGTTASTRGGGTSTIVRPSGATSTFSNPSSYKPLTGNIQVSAEQVKALQAAGETVPQEALDVLAGKSVPGYSLAPSSSTRTIGDTFGNQDGSTLQDIAGIRRDEQDRIFAIDSTGKEIQLTEAQAFGGGLGINADFIPRGSTVSYSQATTGTNSSSGNPVTITQDVLEGLKEKGLTINPNVEITEEKVAEFLALTASNMEAFLPQAKKEFAPYYASQLKVAKDSLLTSLGFSTDDILRQEKELERKYGTDVRVLGEGAADQGFAQSGLRKRDEQDLATDTQNTIDTGRRNLEFNAGGAARSFAQAYGTEATPGYSIKNAPRVLAGQAGFDATSGSKSLYQLSDSVYDGLIGSQQAEQDIAEKARASELETAYNLKYATPEQTRVI